MTNKEIADDFLQWMSKNYSLLKNKYRKFCKEKDYDWDEDVFSDTIIKVYNKIEKGGIKDSTDKGYDCYVFMSFKQNLQREKQYCRVSKRDLNIKSDDINQLYEEWFNDNKDSSTNKIKRDLFKDFGILYIMMKVEENFPPDDFRLFQLKTLIPNMTYNKLAEKTKEKCVRQRIVNIKNWLKDNVSKEEVDKAFQQIYGDLL